MISPRKIIYNNRSNDDYDLICDLAFDGDSGDMSSFLTREAVASETYRGDFKRVHTYKYTETLRPTLTFVKKNYRDFTLAEQREVLKWLTSKRTASFLTVYHTNEDDIQTELTDDDISYEILGAFTEVNTYKLGNGRVVGFTAVFESIAPYAFSVLKNAQRIYNANEIEINVETDEPESFIYPRITIKHTDYAVVDTGTSPLSQELMVLDTVYKYQTGEQTVYYKLIADIDEETNEQRTDENGELQWATLESEELLSSDKTSAYIIHSVNIGSENNPNWQTVTTTIVGNNDLNSTIVIDGANRIISDATSKSRVFGDAFSWNWIGLREGSNQLSFMGNFAATISWREPIKCGEF